MNVRGRLESRGNARQRHVRPTVDDHPHRAFLAVLGEQHDRFGEVRVGQATGSNQHLAGRELLHAAAAERTWSFPARPSTACVTRDRQQQTHGRPPLRSRRRLTGACSAPDGRLPRWPTAHIGCRTSDSSTRSARSSHAHRRCAIRAAAYLPSTLFPSTSSMTIGAIFVACERLSRSRRGLRRSRSRGDRDRCTSSRRAPRRPSSRRRWPCRTAGSSRRATRPPTARRSRSLMPLTDANIDGSPWTRAFFAVASSSSVTGRAPCDPAQLLHELHERRVRLSLTMSPPVRNGPGPLAEREVRLHAVAVALLLADVGIEPRLELPAEDRVHHLERVVVGRVPRRPRVADRERGLRGARLVDEVDRRRLSRRQRRIGERRLLAAARPLGERAIDGGLRLCGLRPRRRRSRARVLA